MLLQIVTFRVNFRNKIIVHINLFPYDFFWGLICVSFLIGFREKEDDEKSNKIKNCQKNLIL